MTNRDPFLTAKWNNLVLFNYRVEPALLARFVPHGVELDQFERKTWLSLVAFQFNQTRLFGFPVPFHRTFEEVNLRFYVKRSGKRGVVFIREFVPKRAVAAIARFAYHENYSCVSMSHRIRNDAEGRIREAEYAWGPASDQCSMSIEIKEENFLPADGSLGQFITEHYWGYAAQPDRSTLEYEVQHEPWRISEARQAVLTGNTGAMYGGDFARVLIREPDSAFFATGSPVTVFKGSRV